MAASVNARSASSIEYGKFGSAHESNLSLGVPDFPASIGVVQGLPGRRAGRHVVILQVIRSFIVERLITLIVRAADCLDALQAQREFQTLGVARGSERGHQPVHAANSRREYFQELQDPLWTVDDFPLKDFSVESD